MVSLGEFIKHHPIFSSLSIFEKTKILPFMKILSIKNGEQLFISNETDKYVYFVSSGSVLIDSDEANFKVKSDKIIGLNEIIDNKSYNYSAIAETDTILVRIPGEKLLGLMNKHPQISMFLLSGKNFTEEECKKNNEPQIKPILAWIFATIIPLLTYTFLGDYLDYPQKIFVSLISSGLAFWIFNVVHESVPGLFIVIISAILNIIPTKSAIVSGFSSDSILLLFGISSLATLLISSGLLYRLSLLIIKYSPKTFINSILFVLGMIITPIIPSMSYRTKLMASVANSAASAFNLKKDSVFATKMTVSCFFGTTSCSSLIVTGSLTNFIAIGFLQQQENFSLQTIGWLNIAIVPVLLIVLANIIMMPLMFYSKEKPSANKTVIKEQIDLLGNFSRSEKYSLYSVSLLFISVLFSSFHFISITWIAMLLFTSLLALKCIDIKDWVKKTNWSFFLFLGSVIGIGAGIIDLGLNETLKNCIIYIANSSLTNEINVLTFIILLSIILRLAFSAWPALVIMMLISFPVSEISGINLLSIMFTLLIISDMWFFPYQSHHYKTFVENLDSTSLLHNKKTFLTYNIIMNAVKISSIYISIPYWKYLGIV